MTPEERDALIDVTVEACAKLAETAHERMLLPDRDTSAHVMVRKVGRVIAADIRKEFRRS